MTGPQDIEDIRKLVRARDPDRYLAALFAPAHAQEALFALYAFHAELARIPDLVSEPMLGEIRLQWWREALEAGEETKSGAPLADALNAAVSAHGLPDALLQGMIDARSADLDGGGFDDVQALKAYLYKSEGAAFALAARILGADGQAGRAANAAGAAYGLVRLLRAVPRDAAAGRVMLPLTLLKEQGLEPDRVLAGEGGKALEAIRDALAIVAREALAQARAELSALPRLNGPAFAPLRLTEPYLRKLEKPGHDPSSEIAEINPLVRYFLLWRAARSGKV